MDAEEYRRVVEHVREVRHDANNPLTAVLGNVQMLLEDPAVRDPEVRETLQIVLNELRRLAEIIRRLNVVREEGLAPEPGA